MTKTTAMMCEVIVSTDIRADGHMTTIDLAGGISSATVMISTVARTEIIADATGGIEWRPPILFKGAFTIDGGLTRLRL